MSSTNIVGNLSRIRKYISRHDPLHTHSSQERNDSRTQVSSKAGRMDQIDQPAQDMIKMMEQFMKSMHKSGGVNDVVKRNGKIFMPGFSFDNVDYAMNEWKIPDNSVFIASYPKTGTAWCMEIVRQLLHGDNNEILKKSKSIPMPVHLLEMGPKVKFDIIDQLPVPRKFFCTHVPADLFNLEKLKESNSKVIYIYRNPKDQAVSWYHFALKLPNLSEELKCTMFGKEWNEFFAKYVAGRHPTGVADGEWYPDHLIGWMKHAKNDGVLLVEYESLKKDFPNELRRIAQHIGVELSDEHAQKVTERCSISAMKKEADSDKSGFLKMNVRKGEVGGWKEQLTVSQSELIDRVMEEKLSGTGIKFTYQI